MSGLMRYPCTACGGRGPHTGPGHAYTTEGPDADPPTREGALLLAAELIQACHRLAPSEDGYEGQELAKRLIETVVL